MHATKKYVTLELSNKNTNKNISMNLNDDVLLQLDTLEPSQETAAISTEQFEKKDDFSLFLISF